MIKPFFVFTLIFFSSCSNINPKYEYLEKDDSFRKKIKIELQDQILNSRLKKIKNTNLKKKDIEALKSVDEDIINDHLRKLKRDNNLPLIVKLMERVNKPPKSSSN